MQLFSYAKRLWYWLTQRSKGTKASEAVQLTLIPEFDFRPTPAFRAFVGNDARFVVANSMDLIMQHQGLMAEMLVLDVHTEHRTATMWLRYKSDELSSKGTATCTLFVGYADQSFDGACGQLRNRKRI
jgi:hypothetical protein